MAGTPPITSTFPRRLPVAGALACWPSRPPAWGWWAPLPVLGLAIAAFWALGWQGPWASRGFLEGLNLVLSTGPVLLGLWLMLQPSLFRSRPGLSLFGFGGILWSASWLAGALASQGDANIMVTIHNLGVWLASLCHLAAAVLEARHVRRPRLPGRWLWPVVLAGLGAVGLTVLVAVRGWTVVFFVQGEGGTLARAAVVGSALATLAVAAAILTWYRGQSAFASWYGLALWALMLGLLGNLAQRSTVSSECFLGRAGQCLGTVYLVVAARAAVKGRGSLTRMDAVRAGGAVPYLTAVLMVAAATALRMTLLAGFGTRFPFTVFYPVVVLAGLQGGLGPGLLATLLAGLTANFLWMDPTGFGFANATDAAGFSFFLANGLVMNLSIRAMHRARAKAARAEAQALASEVRIAAEEALNRTVAELTRSNRDLEQYAYVASHDLQEPLRMVNAYLGLVRERYQGRLDEQADQYLAFALEGAERMKALIRDLLAYARLNAEPRDRVELQACLDSALADLRGAVAEVGGEVTWEPLPSAVADPAQMAQVFANLLGNALKFRGEAPPSIHVGAARGQAEVTVSVADNGIGIDPAHHARIFDIFQRLHPRDSHSGTGIGLAICKKIVEGHGGRLWVESAPGAGAVFRFTLPEAP